MIPILNLILTGDELSKHLRNYIHIVRKFKQRPIDDLIEEGEVSTKKSLGVASVSTEASEIDKAPIKRKTFSPKSDYKDEEPKLKKKLTKEANLSFLLQNEDSMDYEKDRKIKKTPQKTPEKDKEKSEKAQETPEEKRKKISEMDTQKPKANFDSLLNTLLDDGKPSGPPKQSSNLDALFKRNEYGKIASGSKAPKSKFKEDYDIQDDVIGRLFKGYD